MDNQQAKTQFDLGLLVGLVEGEGTITLNKSVKGRCKFQPYIGFANTNLALMEHMAALCARLGLPHYIHTTKAKSGKTVKTIMALGQGRCKRWLDVILPHLVGKKPQADLLAEFIEIREKTISLHPSRKPYGQRELEIKRALHELNTKGKTADASETTCRALMNASSSA